MIFKKNYFILFVLFSTPTFGKTLKLSLQNAETLAIQNSPRLMSFVSDEEAANEQADSQYSVLFPRLTLEASAQYLSEVPDIALGPLKVPLGSHSPYSIGPVLRYTLWDTGSAHQAYTGLSKLAESRQEDKKNAEIQLLLNVRASYIRVQLALEELTLVNGSLELARAQDHDISNRFHAGSSSRLDLILSQRSVLNYQLQFKEKQAELSTVLQDLLSLLEDHTIDDISHPGPANFKTQENQPEKVSLVLDLEPLQRTLSEESKNKISPPDELQPQIQSQKLLAESAELTASSQKASLWPVIQVSAKTSLDYPNGPILEQINQNTFAISLSMPLFEADHTRHLAAEKLKEAESAHHREDQVRSDLHRDFLKAHELLTSLQEQRKLAKLDISQSEEEAKLYYHSYKAGKSNLIDVQTANNQALQAKVNQARITAQLLNQIVTLKALSGKETNHGFD